ncbi:MAG: helix-turn-helix transcriptional regulator [Bacteroidota bacterium]
MNQYSLTKLPKDILEETAQKHKKLRKQQNLSQAQLAERSGVSLGSIKRFEQTGKISLTALLKLAQILGRLKDFESLFEVQEDLQAIEKLFSDKTRAQ